MLNFTFASSASVGAHVHNLGEATSNSVSSSFLVSSPVTQIRKQSTKPGILPFLSVCSAIWQAHAQAMFSVKAWPLVVKTSMSSFIDVNVVELDLWPTKSARRDAAWPHSWMLFNLAIASSSLSPLVALRLTSADGHARTAPLFG